MLLALGLAGRDALRTLGGPESAWTAALEERGLAMTRLLEATMFSVVNLFAQSTILGEALTRLENDLSLLETEIATAGKLARSGLTAPGQTETDHQRRLHLLQVLRDQKFAQTEDNIAFSRTLEEIIATRVFLTATDGLVDITALGQGREGGVVSVNGRSVRLASENSFLTLECSPEGSGQIALRVAGREGSIVLTTPTGGRTALLSVCPGGVQVMYGPATNPATVRLLDGSMELALGRQGGRVTLTDDSVVLRVGKTSLELTPDGIVSRCGGSTFRLVADEDTAGQASD